MHLCRHLACLGLFLPIALASVPASSAEDQPCPTLDPVPLIKLIMPPPSDTSKETLAELRELQDLETLRTLDQKQYARDDYEKTKPDRFLSQIHTIAVNQRPGEPLKYFDNQRPDEALDYLQCIAHQAEHETDEAKTFFNRTRPYNFPNNGLHILKDRNEKDSPSYPSGHATYSMALGLLLAEMLPEKKQEILDRVQDFGHSRLLSGVHFRSDVYAGQIAGAAIIAHFFSHDVNQKPRNQQQFSQRMGELRRALGYP